MTRLNAPLGSGIRSVVIVVPQWGLLEVNRMLCKRFPPSWWLLLHRVHLLFSIPPTTMKHGIRFSFVLPAPLLSSFRPENDDSIPNGGVVAFQFTRSFKFRKVSNFSFFSPIIKPFKFHKENKKKNTTLYTLKKCKRFKVILQSNK